MIDSSVRQRIRRAAKLGVTAIILLTLVFSAVIAVPQLVGASHSYVVTSGSMSPAIQAGDVVIVRDVRVDAIDEGDVITFTRSPASSGRTTHRVVEVIETDDGTAFRTKGDANEEADRSPVPAEQVIGQVMFHVPYAGYVTVFASSKEGLLALVVVPAVLLVVSESYVIVEQARAGTVEERPTGLGAEDAELASREDSEPPEQ